MDIYNTENQNRDYLLQKIVEKKLFSDSLILIDKEVPVPYKHIYIPNNPQTTLEIWCFKQDICVYQELIKKNVGYKDAIFVSKHDRDQDIINIKLEKDSSQKSHPVGLPYVIIETKMGKNINTHELLAYSEKVQMIKTIFPFSRFMMLFFGEPPTRAYRHGLYFDEIEYINNFDDESINNICKVIKDLYKNAIHDIVCMKA